MGDVIILLVEDNPDDAALTLRALEKNDITNAMVKIANNGVEALEYLFGTGENAGRDTTAQPQLILLDLKMVTEVRKASLKILYMLTWV